MILLNKEQADKVRGNYGKYSAIEPVEMNEGYAISIDVLDDPEFSSIQDYLKTLPIQEVTPKPFKEVEL